MYAFFFFNYRVWMLSKWIVLDQYKALFLLIDFLKILSFLNNNKNKKTHKNMGIHFLN